MRPRLDFTKFLRYGELMRAAKALVRWKPGYARLLSIGVSPAGRKIPMLEITRFAAGRAEDKPGYLVHGNIHAPEVSGSAAALYLAYRLLSGAGRDAKISRLLDRVVFYIAPRVSVDGAEECLVRRRQIRSRESAEKRRNALYPSDVDGDGRILQMRWKDPDGQFVAFDDDPDLTLLRLPGEEGGTAYRVAVEGMIHEWDGTDFSDPEAVGLDFNRNWAANWAPRHIQPGAGRYGFSEPETRALADFVCDRGNIFGMLGLHTGPNCTLRPPATKSDSDMAREDVAYFREMARVGSQITGFPARSVAEYRHERALPNRLHGHFTEWAYEHMGVYGFEIELGNMFNSLGFSTDHIFKCTWSEYREMERAAMAWHRAHPEAEAFVQWKPFTHLQLGTVEIGGWDAIARANVLPDDRKDVWHKASEFILELAGHAPRIEMRDAVAEPLGGRLFRIRCRVSNSGGLPTYVTRMAASFSHLKGVTAELDIGRDAERVCGATRIELGHLQARSGGRLLEWVVRAPKGRSATVVIRARAPRAGAAVARLTMG
ncbi:MAG: M14 family metallopeptidase [Planctomycetota bacterium]|nr:M14 family metallopeptidase [Planctomycetota bacterium]